MAWQRHCIRTIQRSRGANEAVRLFEMPVGASGQREHKRLAAAHVGVAWADRELGRGGRCRRAQQRQHRTQCPTHGDVARHTENRSLHRGRRYKTRYRIFLVLRGSAAWPLCRVRLHQSDILLMTPVVTLQRGLPRRAASAQMASLRFLRDDALLHDVTFSFSDGEVRGAHRCVLAYQSPPMWKTSSDLGQLALRRPPTAPVVLYCRRPQALASLVQWSFRPCSPRHTTCFPHRSPVFRAMFDVNSPLQAARLIPLAEKSSSEFDLLLEYCYSCDSKLVTTQTAAPLLMLAEEYQVRKAKALAGSRLARSQEMP